MKYLDHMLHFIKKMAQEKLANVVYLQNTTFRCGAKICWKIILLYRYKPVLFGNINFILYTQGIGRLV